MVKSHILKSWTIPIQSLIICQLLCDNKIICTDIGNRFYWKLLWRHNKKCVRTTAVQPNICIWPNPCSVLFVFTLERYSMCGKIQLLNLVAFLMHFFDGILHLGLGLLFVFVDFQKKTLYDKKVYILYVYLPCNNILMTFSCDIQYKTRMSQHNFG